MKPVGIIAFLLIAMILATGCVDTAERGLNIKNDANFPTSSDIIPSGTPLNQRVAAIFGSIAQKAGFQIGNAPVTTTSSASTSDRQKAYEELMKQMDEESGSSQTTPSQTISPTPGASSNSVPLQNSANSTANSNPNPAAEQNSSVILSSDSATGSSSVKSQPNLLGDYSSFDSGITGWTPVNGTLTYDNSRPHDGIGDAKFVTSASGNNFIAYSVPSSVTAPNTQYTLSGWIATTSPGNNFVQVICYAANGTVLGIFNGTTVGSDNSYQRSTVTFTIPAAMYQAAVQTVTYQAVHTQAAPDQALIDQIVANEALASQAAPGHIEIRANSNGPGTSYIDSIKLELGSQATNYFPYVDFSRIMKYPDVLDLGQMFTYGSYGKEKDVSVYRYRMKSSFEIQYQGRYGPVYKIIEAPSGQAFVFLYVETRYNGTEKFIESPSPSAFTIIANGYSYSYYTVDPSLMTDNQNWNNAYTIHDEFVVADYDGGFLTPGTVRQGMIIFLLPSNAYNNMVARLSISQFSQWWKTPQWRLSSNAA